MNSTDPGRPGNDFFLWPLRRNWCRSLPCRSRKLLTCGSFIFAIEVLIPLIDRSVIHTGLAGDHDDLAVRLDLVAGDLNARLARLLSHAGERRLALAALALWLRRALALPLLPR